MNFVKRWFKIVKIIKKQPIKIVKSLKKPLGMSKTTKNSFHLCSITLVVRYISMYYKYWDRASSKNDIQKFDGSLVVGTHFFGYTQ